ncbi:MAG: hypothetical protein VXX72_09560 [Pseudomonadota bacterium]|nr:hypothetical protein [Pseudomonadota bacterium]
MSVNGGANSEIKLSQLQDYYGGGHPISLAEYYRGAVYVPTTKSGTRAVTINSTGGANSWA